MKKAFIVIFIVIILISTSIYEIIVVNNILTKLETNVQESLSVLEAQPTNIDILLENTKKIRDEWLKVEDVMCLVFNHKDLSEISLTLSKIISNIELENYDDIYIELKLLELILDRSYHIMGFNIQNIL